MLLLSLSSPVLAELTCLTKKVHCGIFVAYGRPAHTRRQGRLFHHSASSGASVRDRHGVVAVSGGGGPGQVALRRLTSRGLEHGRHSLPRLRRVHQQPSAHILSAPFEPSTAGSTPQRLVYVHAANCLRAAAGVLVVARHADSRLPQHLTIPPFDFTLPFD